MVCCCCSVDATKTRHRLGHLVRNTVLDSGNCEMREVRIKGKLHLALYATKDIIKAEELCYCYGESTRNLWWAEKVLYNKLICDLIVMLL